MEWFAFSKKFPTSASKRLQPTANLHPGIIPYNLPLQA